MARKGSGKKTAEDIRSINQEQHAGGGVPVAMTHMVTMILPPLEQEAPDRGAETEPLCALPEQFEVFLGMGREKSIPDPAGE